MSETEQKFWNSLPLYKGFLSVKDSLNAQRYVVLVSSPNNSSFQHWNCECRTNPPPADGEVAQETGARTYDADEIPHPTSNLPERERDSPSLHSSGGSSGPASACSFYMFLKPDVTPPPLKYTLSPKQVNHSFYFCEKVECECDCLHVRPGCWRLRLDTLPRLPVTVTSAGLNLRLAPEQIRGTAGYFLALGLLHENVIQGAVQVLCRFNHKCRHGCSCLYIHADVAPSKPAAQSADTRLSDWAAGAESAEVGELFDFLAGLGVATVGDLQGLGEAAFETLVAQVPARWAESFLTVSAVRRLERKQPLRSALRTFPRVPADCALPDSLRLVGDLLNLPSREFYQLRLAPHVFNACELIRRRYEPDEQYNVVSLAKEPADSFFSIVTAIILAFGDRHAHCSWRKHDPTRPLVTSVFTYVDVNACRCTLLSPRAGEAEAYTVSSPLKAAAAAPQPAEVRCSFGEMPPQAAVGTPRNSWCACPRRWEIAVNYELSTPSGSRCSEQNAMGKLAALGVPTWAVREVFVHGVNVKKEPNPLFPCGVCENMIQKVTKDVNSHYGGDIILYMFDATKPLKIVYLPVPEISHRDGSSFQNFVAHDLRA